MESRLLSFFGKRARKSSVLNCPKCGREMNACITECKGIERYKEISRTYTCKRCSLEYESIELFALKKELPVLFDSVSSLGIIVSDLNSALNKFSSMLLRLQDRASKANEAGHSTN